MQIEDSQNPQQKTHLRIYPTEEAAAVAAPLNTTAWDTEPGNHLERLRIPKFSGNYTDRSTFRDLRAMVIENTRLSLIQKMGYLRPSARSRDPDLISQNTKFGGIITSPT